MKGGSLYDALSLLRKAAVKRLPIDAILRMALDVTNGLAYLHASSFSFGDLKTMNVLLSGPVDLRRATIPPGVKAKLCDFGLSRNLKHLVDSDAPPRPDETVIAARNGPAGTFAYMAPEAFSGLPVDDAEAPKRADIFALGVVLWELGTLRKPWPGKQAFQLLKLVGLDGQRLRWGRELAWLPKRYVSLVEWCWKEDALQRPTVAQVAKVLEDLNRDFQSGEFDGLITSREDERNVDGPPGSMADIMNTGSVSEDADIRQVEEEVLSTDEFENFRMRLGVGSRGESTEAGVGDTELSDVTGELQRTGSHSKIYEHDGESLVHYVETEEKTKSMLMLDQIGGLTEEELEEEFDGFVESGVAGYLEREEENKLVMLDGTRPAVGGLDEGSEGCTGDEREDITVDEYLETEEKTKSVVVSERFEGVDDGLDDDGLDEKFAALNLEFALEDAVKDSGMEYLEMEERTKSTEMSAGITGVGDKVGVGVGKVMEQVWEEKQTGPVEQAFVEELELSKSKVMLPAGAKKVMEAERKFGGVRRGSKSVGQNIETVGVPDKRVRSRSYLVPRVCMLESDVETELEEVLRIPSKGPRLGNLDDGREGRREKNGEEEEKSGSVKAGIGKGIGTDDRRMGLAWSRRLYNVGMVDWSGADEEMSRWEEEELDIGQSGVDMFSRPHFK